MTDGLKKVQKSLEKCIKLDRGGEVEKGIKKLSSIISKGLEIVREEQEKIVENVQDLHQINNTFRLPII